jgi:putative polyketide hydroxylase
LLDGHFILLVGSDGEIWREAAAAIAASLGIEVTTYCVGPEADLLDLEHGWAEKFGASSESAVLVRPDGFVAWRANASPADAGSQLEQVFLHILGRSTEPARS